MSAIQKPFSTDKTQQLHNTIKNGFSQARLVKGHLRVWERVWMWRMLNVGVCCVTKCTLSQICIGSLAGSGGPRWPLLLHSPIVLCQMSSDARVPPKKQPPYSSASSMRLISAFSWTHPDVCWVKCCVPMRGNMGMKEWTASLTSCYCERIKARS